MSYVMTHKIQDKNTDLMIKHLACPLITFNSMVMAKMGQSMLQTSQKRWPTQLWSMHLSFL